MIGLGYRYPIQGIIMVAFWNDEMLLVLGMFNTFRVMIIGIGETFKDIIPFCKIMLYYLMLFSLLSTFILKLENPNEFHSFKFAELLGKKY